MKDVTVVMELTVPRDLSDQEIKSVLERALTMHLVHLRTLKDPSADAFSCVPWEGVLGIDNHISEVVGVRDGEFVSATALGFRDTRQR